MDYPDSKVDMVRMEPGTAGRYKGVIVLEMSDSFEDVPCQDGIRLVIVYRIGSDGAVHHVRVSMLQSVRIPYESSLLAVVVICPVLC